MSLQMRSLIAGLSPGSSCAQPSMGPVTSCPCRCVQVQGGFDGVCIFLWVVQRSALLLRSSKRPLPHFTHAPQDIVVPIAIDNSLPEYLIRTEGYAERMRVQWQPGDRFRMFFGGKISSKTHKKIKTGGHVYGFRRWFGLVCW